MAIKDNTRVSDVIAHKNSVAFKQTLTLNEDRPDDGFAYKAMKKETAPDGVTFLRFPKPGDDNTDLFYLPHQYVGLSKGQQVEYAVPMDFSSPEGGIARLKKDADRGEFSDLAKNGSSVSIGVDGCLLPNNTGAIKNLKLHVIDAGAGPHLNEWTATDVLEKTDDDLNASFARSIMRTVVRVGV